MKWDRFDNHPFSASTTGPLHQHQLELKLSLVRRQPPRTVARTDFESFAARYKPGLSFAVLASHGQILGHARIFMWDTAIWMETTDLPSQTLASLMTFTSKPVGKNCGVGDRYLRSNSDRQLRTPRGSVWCLHSVLVSRGFLSSPPVEIVKSIVLAGLLIDSPAISQTFISLPIPEKHGQMVTLIQTIYIYNYYYYCYLLQKSLVVQASILKQNIQNIWWPSWLPFSTTQLLVGVNA